MTDSIDHAPAPRLRLTLRQLEVFVATARGGSTRAAAGSVARSQSAASSALSELERQIGVQLFDRIGRRLRLNAQGQLLLPQAVALLDHAADVEALFAGEVHAPLRLAASMTIGEYLLPERVASWKLLHPQATVRMQVANSSEVIEAVATLRADVGFIEGPQTHPDVRLHAWLDDELVIVAAPTHPLAATGVRPGLRELAAAAWILREPGSGTRQASDAWLARLGPLKVEFELGSTEAIKRLVAAGAGVACLSRHTVQRSIDHGVLAELRTRLPPARRKLAIAVHRNRRLPASAQAFVAHCHRVEGDLEAAGRRRRQRG